MKAFVALVALIAVASANPLNSWSVADLNEAVTNPNTNPTLRPFLELALNQLMSSIASGVSVDSIVVPTPTNTDVYTAPSAWTLQQLSEALQHPHTDPTIVPMLEVALDELMSSLFSGQNVNAIVINLPVENVEAEPLPVVPIPEPVPEEIEIPVRPAPVTSPLVQIIVNINGKQQVTNIAPVKPTPPTYEYDADTLALLRSN